jgi:lipoyl(octanoyl) transferase
VKAEYFGKIPFNEALAREEASFQRVVGGGPCEIFAFETGPVITLGVRGSDADIHWSASELDHRGFQVYRLDRGGQATLHNPGQLVIFPIVPLQGQGTRAWVEFLLAVTQEALRELGKEVRCQAGQPGLFSSLGKVAAIGIRVRQGISTHGIAINVTNDLSDFSGIRPCGITDAPVDRLGTAFVLEDVFAAWLRNFKHGLTTRQDLTNLGCSTSDVRL